MKKILFVCVHNAGRSQIAEAYFNRYSTFNKAIAFSAGTKPANAINPVVIDTMKEAGFDLSGKKPKLLTLEMMENSDKVITMGCGVEDTCPATFIPAEDWQIEDPEGKPIEAVRQIRNDIEQQVKKLVSKI
jgi:arsenate reductase (thioredoxin)